MGMYTGLRIKVTVKEEYRSMINQINKGATWSEFVEQFPFLSNYAALNRAGSIPNGILCYMPSSWETGEYPNGIATDGFDTKIDMNTGYWSFQCSLKNYEREIEKFFDEVLVNIISNSEHIEYLYEEWDESNYYNFVNGSIKSISDQV
ncbi:hypothetical protein ABE196_18850 [Bacillus subtilis]